MSPCEEVSLAVAANILLIRQLMFGGSGAGAARRAALCCVCLADGGVSNRTLFVYTVTVTFQLLTRTSNHAISIVHSTGEHRLMHVDKYQSITVGVGTIREKENNQV